MGQSLPSKIQRIWHVWDREVFDLSAVGWFQGTLGLLHGGRHELVPIQHREMMILFLHRAILERSMLHCRCILKVLSHMMIIRQAGAEIFSEFAATGAKERSVFLCIFPEFMMVLRMVAKIRTNYFTRK
jgi:hypothetical protein